LAGKNTFGQKRTQQGDLFFAPGRTTRFPPDLKTLLTTAEEKFQDLCDRAETVPLASSLVQIAVILKKLGASHADRLVESCAWASVKGSFVQLYLEYFWGKYNFVPLNRVETAPIIAKILKGQGQSDMAEKMLATVIVQTLPELASTNFREVKIYDVSKAQIDFHRKLKASLEDGSLNSFTKQVKQEFKDYITMHSKKTNLEAWRERQIDGAFRDLYDKLLNVPLKSNITAEQIDIFEAVNNEKQDAKHDVVFLSTIPSLTFKSWPLNYGHIRKWVLEGKTVVYCLLSTILCSTELLQELAFSFNDIANVEYICPEETPILAYVKLSPLAK
jgi:hypothetical protein